MITEFVRSSKEKHYLSSAFETMAAIKETNLIFAMDECIVSTWNAFFSEHGASTGDEKYLASMTLFSKAMGNEKNAKIIHLELDRMASAINSSLQKKELSLIHTLCPENIRTRLRNISDPNNDLFDYRKNFNGRFMTCVSQYNMIAPNKPSLVLDIGAGMGVLPYIFNYNEHQVDALDIPECGNVFDEGCKILGVDKKSFTVEKYTPLIRFDHKFDIVISTLICFNNHGSTDLWLREEWMFFLKDLHDNQLNEGGRVFLVFNKEKTQDSENKLVLGHEQVHELFDPFMVDAPNLSAKLAKSDIGTLLMR